MKNYSACIIVIILAVISSACGAQPAQGSSAPIAEQLNDDETILLWEGPALFAEDQTECHRLKVTKDDQAFFGLCDGQQTEVEFVTNQEGGLALMIAHFAPFQADMPQGRITFNGAGQIAGPAWERAITTWAQITYAELAANRVGATNRTVLAWNLGESLDQQGQCRMLLVLSHGYATAGLTPCTGGQMQRLADGWVETAAWEQFDTWLYSRAPLYQDSSYLDGRGTYEMNKEEIIALNNWAEGVYKEINHETK